MGIEEVFFQEKVDGHKNDDREIFVAYNEDIEGFIPKSVRLLYLYADTYLGDHWRECNELLYHIDGPEVRVYLGAVKSQDFESFVMKKGSRLFIPSSVGLRVESKPGVILLSMIDRLYESNADWDHKFVNSNEFWRRFIQEY